MAKQCWIAILANLAFPAIAILLWCFAERPAAVDWQSKSLPARVPDVLLYLQLAYALVLVALMKGRRIATAIVCFVMFGISFAINFAAWLSITGVYL